jgi:ABC-type polysaccharide/polyol phosphate export permease
MKKYYLPPIVAFILTLGFLYALTYFKVVCENTLVDIYSKKLQVPLFTGFLTISGFLLSLTAFIVVKMHEAVYQDENYLEKTAVYTRIDPSYSHTKPLENLTIFLIVSVVTALITSFAQFTIGNLNSYHIAIICMSLAVGAFGFVLTSCFVIKQNIKDWIDFMRAKKLKDFEEKQKKQNENSDQNVPDL